MNTVELRTMLLNHLITFVAKYLRKDPKLRSLYSI